MNAREPNVVIIMVDEQKADSLPLYGNPIVQAPNLARLAGEGVLFRQAYATCPLCVPARVSLMTGRYPHTTGSRTNAFAMEFGERHLFEIMHERGYRLGLSGKNHCFFGYDLDLCDEVWLASHNGPLVLPNAEAAAAAQWIRDSQVGRRAWGAARNPYPPEALGTALITDQAIAFVERYREEPFCLWYSIADPHTPLQTSSPYAEMYRPDDIPLPPQLEGEMETKPPAQQIDYRALCGDKVSEEIMRRAIATYYGMNTYIDDQVGRFLRRLDELGLRENTVVIYLSDHGDYMGEHRMIRKSKALYDCLCHIPLIVSWPAGIAPGPPREEFVCIEDILPTVMDLLGWPIPRGVQGTSFAPLLGGPGIARPILAHLGGPRLIEFSAASRVSSCSPLGVKNVSPVDGRRNTTAHRFLSRAPAAAAPCPSPNERSNPRHETSASPLDKEPGRMARRHHHHHHHHHHHRQSRNRAKGAASGA